MDKQSRRDAIRDYKEKKPAPGIYAVRCAATGEAWVGASPNIEAQENRLWFGLRAGGHPNPAIRAAWTAHGRDGLTFEVLEKVEAGDLTALGLADLIKAREQHWRGALRASKAVG